MCVHVLAGRAEVAEAHDVALRLQRELEIAALAYESGELSTEFPELLDVRAEPVGADGREAEISDQRELRAGAFERARSHVLVARVAAAEEVLGLLGERPIGVARARVRE